jgi:hypothetical protein
VLVGRDAILRRLGAISGRAPLLIQA